MSEFINPEKLVEFASKTFKDFCVNKPSDVVIKVHDLNPNLYQLQGGISDIAISPYNRRIPVVLMQNKFWIHFSIEFKFVGKNHPKTNTHIFDKFSMQLFKKNSNETVLLFRAEWDSHIQGPIQHPQPHWHFHPQIDHSVEDKYLPEKSFQEYLEMVKGEGYEKEFYETRPSNNITKFHFAMAACWQDNRSEVVPFTEKGFRYWLPLCLKSINEQLIYSYS